MEYRKGTTSDLVKKKKKHSIWWALNWALRARLSVLIVCVHPLPSELTMVPHGTPWYGFRKRTQIVLKTAIHIFMDEIFHVRPAPVLDMV